MKVYKLKSLQEDGLLHVIDSIINERIYLSTREFMNDINEAHWKCLGDCVGDTVFRNIADNFRSHADSIRFTSFLEKIDNHLMWAHYAGGFSGVALEYDIDESCYRTEEIKYTGIPDVSKESMEKVLNEEMHITETGVLKRKDSFWSYEGEQRVFGNSSARYLIEMQPKALIFGSNLSEASIQHAVLKKVANMSGIRLGYLVPITGTGLTVEYEEK